MPIFFAFLYHCMQLCSHSLSVIFSGKELLCLWPVASKRDILACVFRYKVCVLIFLAYTHQCCPWTGFFNSELNWTEAFSSARMNWTELDLQFSSVQFRVQFTKSSVQCFFTELKNSKPKKINQLVNFSLFVFLSRTNTTCM